jgi:hypothetical protein
MEENSLSASVGRVVVRLDEGVQLALVDPDLAGLVEVVEQPVESRLDEPGLGRKTSIISVDQVLRS